VRSYGVDKDFAEPGCRVPRATRSYQQRQRRAATTQGQSPHQEEGGHEEEEEEEGEEEEEQVWLEMRGPLRLKQPLLPLRGDSAHAPLWRQAVGSRGGRGRRSRPRPSVS